MQTIAIVGHIGAGKSRIVGTLTGYPTIKVVDLDQVAKDMRDTERELFDELTETFGSQIINPNYVMDVIFNNDMLYQQLMSIYEPYFYNYIEDCQQEMWDLENMLDTETTLIIEGAALIHSEELLSLFDRAIWVNTTQDICRERTEKRNRYTSDQVSTLLFKTDPQMSVIWQQWMINHPVHKIASVDGCDLEGMANWVLHFNETVNKLMAQTKNTAIYAGSFNPFHIGHLAVVEELSRLFDNVIILRCINGGKVNPLSAQSQQIRMIDETRLPSNVSVIDWTNSFIDFLITTNYEGQHNLTIVRGVRNGTDLQYENDYIQHLRDMYNSKNISRPFPIVIYIPTKPEYAHISSSAIKAIEPFNPEYANSLKV